MVGGYVYNSWATAGCFMFVEPRVLSRHCVSYVVLSPLCTTVLYLHVIKYTVFFFMLIGRGRLLVDLVCKAKDLVFS